MAYVSHQIRSGTKAVWEFNNPVLDNKEIAFEVLDTGIGTGNINIKQGDGVHTWNELPYAFYYPDSLIDEKVKTVKRAVNDDKSIYIAGTYDTVDHVGIEYIDDSIFIGSTKGELNSLSLKTKQITVNPNEDGIIISTVKSLKKGITINAEFSTGIFIDNKATNITNAGLDSAGYGLFIDNNSIAGIGIHNHVTGSGISIGNYTTGYGEYINNISTGRGLVIDNRGIGQGISINNIGAGYGQYISNSAGGRALHIANISAGYGIVIDNAINNSVAIAINMTSNCNGISITNSGTGWAQVINNNSTGYAQVIYNNSTNTGIYVGNNSTGNGINIDNFYGTGIHVNNTRGGSGIVIVGETTSYNIDSDGLNRLQHIHTSTINSYTPTDIIASNICRNVHIWKDDIYHNTNDIPTALAVQQYCDSWDNGRRIYMNGEARIVNKDGWTILQTSNIDAGVTVGNEKGDLHLIAGGNYNGDGQVCFHTPDWLPNANHPFMNIQIMHRQVDSNLTFIGVAFVPSSLVELKKDISILNKSGLDLVNSTDVYNYRFKTQKSDDEYLYTGFVIGEDYNLASDLLSDKKDGINLYSSIAVAYKAIQELTKENNDLKSRCNDLHYRLEKIEQLLLK